jgi:hypothetical protein
VELLKTVIESNSKGDTPEPVIVITP